MSKKVATARQGGRCTIPMQSPIFLGWLTALWSGTDARAGALTDTVDLLRAIGDSIAESQRCSESQLLNSLKQEIGAAFSGTAQERSSPCDEPAVAYLSTSDFLVVGDNSSILLEIGGVHGTVPFAFASGTAQSDIIAAITSLAESTGVDAAQSKDNPQRVELRSVMAGASSFVSVQQIPTSAPIVFPDALRGAGTHALHSTGLGSAPGDANCDRMVNEVDLTLVLGHWGECPPRPPCWGDVNNDGAVGVGDLLDVMNHWGDTDQAER